MESLFKKGGEFIQKSRVYSKKEESLFKKAVNELDADRDRAEEGEGGGPEEEEGGLVGSFSSLSHTLVPTAPPRCPGRGMEGEEEEEEEGQGRRRPFWLASPALVVSVLTSFLSFMMQNTKSYYDAEYTK